MQIETNELTQVLEKLNDLTEALAINSKEMQQYQSRTNTRSFKIEEQIDVIKKQLSEIDNQFVNSKPTETSFILEKLDNLTRVLSKIEEQVKTQSNRTWTLSFSLLFIITGLLVKAIYFPVGI